MDDAAAPDQICAAMVPPINFQTEMNSGIGEANRGRKVDCKFDLFYRALGLAACATKAGPQQKTVSR